MSEGIRIQPRSELGFPDGAMVVVVDHSRPYPDPELRPVCSVCGVTHWAKTYHLQLEAGAVIVSTGVWAALRRLADNPFVVANPVAAPPAQHLTVPTARVSVRPSSL